MPLLLKARMTVPALKQEACTVTGTVLSLGAAQSQQHIMRRCTLYVSALLKNANITASWLNLTTCKLQWQESGRDGESGTVKFLFCDSHQIYLVLFFCYQISRRCTEYITLIHVPCIFYCFYFNQPTHNYILQQYLFI